MSPTGREHWHTLLEAYRFADYRRFRARHRSNRWGEFLGVGPDGQMLGWWDGQEQPASFDPDDRQWCQITILY